MSNLQYHHYYIRHPYATFIRDAKTIFANKLLLRCRQKWFLFESGVVTQLEKTNYVDILMSFSRENFFTLLLYRRYDSFTKYERIGES